MKQGTAKSHTADLFAEPAPSAPASPLPSKPQPRRPLWYAAVFPDLNAAVDSTNAALRRLAGQALAFTSCVSLEPPNALLLEIRGSVKLFGSLPALHADLDAAWSGLARSAIAPSTLAALWMARAAERSAADFSTRLLQVEDVRRLSGQLAKVPIVCTGWDAERLQTLRSMGIVCLGELLRLPRGGVARRLSPAVLLDLDIALARQPSPRRAFVPLERFHERCDFETEIEHVAYLEKALEPLIERCAQFLRARQAGVQQLQLKLRHRELPATRLRLGLASITGERRRLGDVIAQRLTRLELKAPLRGIELIAGPLRGLSASSVDAFAGSAAGGRDTAPQLVERLRARLGEAAVYGVIPIPEHRPEAAWQRVKELRLTSVPVLNEESMPRPVWLLQEPLAIGRPSIQQGPERIESGWWDGKGVARDYYVARQSRGAKLWVFQERKSKHWYLHGVFA